MSPQSLGGEAQLLAHGFDALFHDGAAARDLLAKLGEAGLIAVAPRAVNLRWDRRSQVRPRITRMASGLSASRDGGAFHFFASAPSR